MKLARISTKLFLSHASIGLLSILAFSIMFYYIMRETIVARTTNQLASINALKRDRLDNYFRQTQTNVGFLFSHDFFIEHFDARQTQLTPQNFPREVGHEIDAIGKQYGFEQVSVVNNDYQQVYSTDASSIPFKQLLHPATASASLKKFDIIDASTDVNNGEVVLLYVVPLQPDHINTIGWIVIKENFGKIQQLLNEHTGMGSSGESYLVGPDRRMRSASRFSPGTPPLEVIVSADHPLDSIGNNADHVLVDYRGVRVISFASTLRSSYLDWRIVSEIDLAQAMEPVDRLRNYLTWITIVMMVVVMIVTAIISKAISRPILRLKEIIITLSKGIIPSVKAGIKNKDEIGEIAHAVDQLVSGMKQTAGFAYAIGAGQFESSFTLLSEQDAMGNALIHMRDQLRTIHERELRLVREKTSALLEGQENERMRIVRELHDGVGQLLTAIRIQLQMMEGPPEIAAEISRLVNETIEEVRRISYNVMPNTLVDFGFEAALRSLCDNVKKYSGLQIDLQYVRDTDLVIPFDVGIALFRIAQEGLNNIVKHAGAKNVELHIIEKSDEVYFMLKDDGKGFLKGSSHTGFGLRSMQERARLLGGELEIDTSPGSGTVLELHLPR